MLHLWLVSVVLVGLVTAEICYEKECQFTFNIQWTRTMTYTDPNTGTVYNVRYHHHQFEIVSTAVGTDDEAMIGRHVAAEDVITGDGNVRNIITINGKFPGPTIEVMEGANVTVHVYNGLHHESTSIHWHGIHQYGTPWMDGVPDMTQCPISPKQTFTYHFTASPGGTHWYHSHLANQRQDGLYGMFIIHRHLPILPYFPMVISDFYKHDAMTINIMNSGVDEMERHRAHMGHHNAHKMMESQVHNVLINGRGCFESHTLPLSKFYVEHGQWYKFHIAHAGADFGYKVSFENHKVRVLASDGFDIEPIEVDVIYIYPGETIDIELTSKSQVKTDLFWIRVEEMMLHDSPPKHEHMMAVVEEEKEDHTHPMPEQEGDVIEQEQIDTHPMRENSSTGHHSKRSVAMKGHDMMGKMDHDGMNHTSMNGMMNHNMMNHDGMNHDGMNHDGMNHDGMNHDGMNHDGMNHESMDHETMDHNMEMEGMDHSGHHVEGKAILEYTHGATAAYPEYNFPVCESHCKAFNCPGKDIDPKMHCVHYDTIKGSTKTNSDWWNKLRIQERPDEEYVLNFILSGNPDHSGSSINGKKFIHPHASVFEIPLELQSTSDCSVSDRCSHALHLPANRTINLIFSNIQGDQPIYAHHPVHLHGHSYAVLYMGYPSYGNYSVSDALGLLCQDKYCDRVTKSHLHFNKRHTLDSVYNTVNPPIKDTLLIPARGFAVVRILTDNPGVWFLHCHVAQHLMDGMAMIMQTGSQAEFPNLPEGFPTCKTKHSNNPTVKIMESRSSLSAVSASESNRVITLDVWVVVVIGIVIIVLSLLLIIGIVYIYKLKPKHPIVYL